MTATPTKKPRAYPREQRNRVTLSAEGRERLCPRLPMFGTVIARDAWLVTVKEDSGVTAEYHPDFIEEVRR